jgi:hypothetical protein
MTLNVLPFLPDYIVEVGMPHTAIALPPATQACNTSNGVAPCDPHHGCRREIWAIVADTGGSLAAGKRPGASIALRLGKGTEQKKPDNGGRIARRITQDVTFRVLGSL